MHESDDTRFRRRRGTDNFAALDVVVVVRFAALMRTPKLAAMGLMTALLASTTVFATPLLLVPGSEDAAVRSALDAVAAAAAVEVASPAATTELLNAASASGLTCPAADVACWQQLGSLGGFQTVVVVTADAVVVATPMVTTTAPRLLAGTEGLGPAVRRAFLQRAALQLAVDVADATISVDGVSVSVAVVDDLVPGAHVVAVDAVGYVPLSREIVLAGGAVERPVLILSPLSPSSSSSSLFIAGVGALGVGGAVALGAIGFAGYSEQAANGTCTASSTGVCDNARTGWLLAIGGGAVGLVGLGLTALSLQ